ncbi:hypothetical protein V1505DRAFT_416931 [Lipomyces doorenjongii]
MSSSVNPSDSEQLTTTETLKRILRLSERAVSLPLKHSNHRTFVIPLALALLDRGYNPKSLSDDLWMKLANDKDRLEHLSQLIFPVDGSFHNVSSLSGISPVDPLTWKDVATRFQRSIFLDELHDWTYSFLVDMLIPMKTKGKTPTPSELIRRDGWFSVVGQVLEKDAPSQIIPLSTGSGRLQVAHIMPFSASKRKPLRNLLSVFAGEDMEELLTGNNINDPSNALLLDAITHEAFDSFEFGLEFQNKRYFLRLLDASRPPQQLLWYNDGDEIFFCQESQGIANPSALFCNIHLAIGHVLHDSGIAGLIDKILQDEEELNIGNVEGDYWLRVSASYLQRELRGLQEVDDSAIELDHNTTDSGMTRQARKFRMWGYRL